MKVDVVPVNSFQRKLQVSIPAATVKGELDKAYGRLRRQVRLPGFRPGKAPRKVLEARFGQQVRGDVAQTLIEDSWRACVTEHGIEPVGRPSVDAPQLPGTADYEFTITVDVRPDIELEQYSGVEVEYPAVEVAAEEVDAEVSRRLEGEQRLVEVDRAVQEGDFVVVELTATAEGEDEPVAREMGTMLRTASDPYYPGVESLVIGLKPGEEASGTVTFAEGARNEDVAGRELDVTVKVHTVSANEIPELTDDLASDLGYEGGVAGMRAAIEMALRAQRDGVARNQARANLLQALIDRNPFDVPEGMVEDQLEALVEELKYQEAMRGRDPRNITFSEAQMADLRARSRFACKGGLILEYVSKKESIEVTDADLEAKYVEMAEERGQTVEAIKGYLVKDGVVEVLRERLLEERTLDWLLEHAELKEPAEAPAAEAAPAEAPAAQAAPADEPAAEVAAADEPAAQEEEEAVDLSSMTSAQLKELAKSRGLKGYSSMKKADLIELLS